jgi:hypothetical protein
MLSCGILVSETAIFLRSFVLRGFSIVLKSEVPEGQLETKFAPGSNPAWMSERN